MMNIRKHTAVFSLLTMMAVFGVCLIMEGCGKKPPVEESGKSGEASYWTCGMHPSVRVTNEQYENGTKNCPVCNMALIFVPSPEQGSDAPAPAAEAYYGCGVKEEGHCPHCDEGKPDAECVCGGHSFLIKSDKPINCPVCKKPLSEIPPKEMGQDKEAVSRLNLKPQEMVLAGIRTAKAAKHHLFNTVRAVGMVAYDPELTVAQEEFITAVETRRKVKDSSDLDVIGRADDLVEKSKFKLKLLGMGDDEISDLEKEGRSQMELVLPGDKAWVYADIYESDLGWVKPGQEVAIKTTAYPGEEFSGMVKSISPVLDQKTRSAKARIEADNSGDKLKSKMYADVLIKSAYTAPDGKEEILIVPVDAVLDTGTRKIIYITAGGGEFLGKVVETGPKATVEIDGKDISVYPILSGLAEGDIVVTRGNFLIDSQSQISGAAAAVYGGALGKEEKNAAPAHQH